MAGNSTFTPKESLTEAPTNLKEAVDWVLRVTGKDGKKLGDGECICGLAAAVTDLLQSVQLEYNGYQGDVKNGTDSGDNKGATSDKVTEHLNGLFSLVQGLGGTAVVRTYIDQLAQVLSALIGWSRIVQCKGKKQAEHGTSACTGGKCQYLEDVKHENKCETCGCMKWEVPKPGDHTKGHHLGRGCTRCKDAGGSSDCSCTGDTCTPDKCQCAKEGKCCKCCCNGSQCKEKCKKNAKCSCIENDTSGSYYRIYNGTYQSAYASYPSGKFFDKYGIAATWIAVEKNNTLPGTPSHRRHHCARIFLGSVCLIWSGITYMYWTGKYPNAKNSPYWNNHILDGSGLDDGTLSQWLQALGFPRDMLNNHGPGNRLDAVIWDGLRDKLYLGFPDTSNSNVHGKDTDDNTFRNPAGMNYAGYIHTLDRGAFDKEGPFKDDTDPNQHKRGALFKLYILSCAYFTGLQQKRSTQSNTPRNPKTIREILYWLSALPYSQAYKEMLKYSKGRLEEVLKKPGETDSTTSETQLKFTQQGRSAPITVHEFNLFAHFQAVTQYCPLVLIGIQGGLHSATKGTDKTLEPAIHSLYANTECNFTYPSVDIQAYNQVVHYIRALFYQLYFLRKQCAVKVTCGGKWRECRYGSGVVSKGVISWMCLGCDPMEHDRKCRVEDLKKGLDGVKEWKDEAGENTEEGGIAEKLKEVLEKIGEVVVQLGNAQEALERKEKEAILGVKDALDKAKQELEGAKGNEVLTELYGVLEEKVDDEELEGGELTKAKGKLDELTNGGNSGKLGGLTGGEGLGKAKDEKTVDPGKNRISEVIHKVREVLTGLENGLEAAGKNEEANTKLGNHQEILLKAIKDLISVCNNAKCDACQDHINKCGKQPVSRQCPTCHQQYMDGTPSPLQAFLEDRLPGFSCDVVRNTDQPDYPAAASHLGHCGGSGQCCPLPMGFRGQFQERVTNTGHRLYGILYFFSNENMMQSCVYTLVRVTAALSATTPQVLGDVFGFFRGGVGEKERGMNKSGGNATCGHTKDPSTKGDNDYFCGWCASGLRDEVKKIEWIPKGDDKDYRTTVGKALIEIKGDKGSGNTAYSGTTNTTTSNLSTLTDSNHYVSPLTGELYTAVSATFGGTYLSWVLYLSDALYWGLQSLASAFKEIECRGCKGNCDPNKCKKGSHGGTDSAQCNCSSIVSCTGVLPVLYRHGFSYGNPFNLEGYEQKNEKSGDYSIEKKKDGEKHCHQFLESLSAVINKKEEEATSQDHPLTELLKQVGALQYDIRLPWIFVLTLAWLVAVLYLAFGAIWPLDWTHMRSHWLRGGEHQWQCMWYKVMTGRKGMELVEYFGRR